MKVALAVIVAAIKLLPFIAPFWFIVMIFHFGFISGPDPTLTRWLSSMLGSLPPVALVFAKILSNQVVCIGRRISFLWAFVTAIVSLAFVQVGMGIITLYQYVRDELVFFGGLALGLGSAIFLTQLLSQQAE